MARIPTSSPEQYALDMARREASRLSQESAALGAQVDELRAQVSDLEGTLLDLRQTSAGLEAQIREREDELSAARSTQQELIVVFQQEIEDGQIQVERLRDSLRVDMVNEILFDSGEVTLKPEGIDVLRRMARY